MRVVWIIVGVLVGLVVGLIVGFSVALVAISQSTSHNDGTYGMREMLVCLPAGAILGLSAGLYWGFTTGFATG